MAMLTHEGDHELLLASAVNAPEIVVSAVTMVEIGIVLTRRIGLAALTDLESLLTELSARIIAFTESDVREAVLAFEHFGKGRHPAALNFGDCFSYALAKKREDCLLFVGNDFSQTDIRPAVEVMLRGTP